MSQIKPAYAVATHFFKIHFNPLNAELNPICHLLALLGAHHILHVSGLRVNNIPLVPSFLLPSDSSTKVHTPHAFRVLSVLRDTL